MGKIMPAIQTLWAKTWGPLAPIHRLSAASLGASCACMGIVLVFGTAARWDGQGAILVLPFVLFLYAALPASAVLAVIGLWTSWRASLILLGTSLPGWLLVWIVMKG